MTYRFVCDRDLDSTPIRVWWRCTVMDSGELCVMTHLIVLMLTLYADNWDTLELQHLVWTQTSKYGFVMPVYKIIQCVLLQWH